MTVGERICHYLDSNGIKQRWLAEQLDISETKMSNILNSRTSIDAELLFRICKVLNVSSELFR